MSKKSPVVDAEVAVEGVLSQPRGLASNDTFSSICRARTPKCFFDCKKNTRLLRILFAMHQKYNITICAIPQLGRHLSHPRHVVRSRKAWMGVVVPISYYYFDPVQVLHSESLAKIHPVLP